MGELREWTAWYKANRSLLLGGDVVRVDLPEHGAFLRGVVTPDAAVYSLCLTETPAVANRGQVVLPGLDPDADHRVRPLLLSFRGAAPVASTPPPPASDASPG